jgi:hypothetical protein
VPANTTPGPAGSSPLIRLSTPLIRKPSTPTATATNNRPRSAIPRACVTSPTSPTANPTKPSATQRKQKALRQRSAPPKEAAARYAREEFDQKVSYRREQKELLHQRRHQLLPVHRCHVPDILRRRHSRQGPRQVRRPWRWKSSPNSSAASRTSSAKPSTASKAGAKPTTSCGNSRKVSPMSFTSGRNPAASAGDTRVLMADGGSKPIRDVKLGDAVLSADPETGEQGARSISAVCVHEDNVVTFVTDSGSVLTTTADHPFWNATDRQWQRADRLACGDALFGSDGNVHNVTMRVSTCSTTRSRDCHTLGNLATSRPDWQPTRGMVDGIRAVWSHASIMRASTPGRRRRPSSPTFLAARTRLPTSTIHRG